MAPVELVSSGVGGDAERDYCQDGKEQAVRHRGLALLRTITLASARTRGIPVSAVGDPFEALLAAGDGLLSKMGTAGDRASSVTTTVDGDSHVFAVFRATQGAFDIGGFHNPSRFQRIGLSAVSN